MIYFRGEPAIETSEEWLHGVLEIGLEMGVEEGWKTLLGVKLTGCDESPPAFGITAVSVLSGKPSRDGTTQ
jgi:hypothetical protein